MTAKTLPIKFGQRTVEVRREGPGFRVAMLFRPAMEDMFETFSHVALFGHEADARLLADRVRHADEIDLAHWTWHVSKAAPWKFMHEQSEARPEMVARPASARLRRAIETDRYRD